MHYPKTSTVALLALLTACQTMHEPLPTVNKVDLQKFMGDWYVIASIPTFIEKDAYNAVESYRLTEDGTVETTFTFEAGVFGGKKKIYRPTGYIRDTQSNAVWGMQFIWPIKGDYRIIYLTDDYSVTVIGRNKRDYVWLMAREPVLSEQQYDEAMAVIADAGYDLSRVQRVPQHWPAIR